MFMASRSRRMHIAWSTHSTLMVLLSCFLTVVLGHRTATAGAFTVTISESPLLILEGVAFPQGDGTARVDVAWVLDGSSAGVSMLPLRTQPGEPHVQLDRYMIADFDVVTKYSILRAVNVDYPDSPVPDGLSWMASVPPANTAGWSWCGIMYATDLEIQASIDGSGPLASSTSSNCQELDTLEGDVRQIIDLGDGLLLIIVVRNGQVFMMVYRLDENGCWRFVFSPSYPGGPGGPGGPAAPAEPWWGDPPSHSFEDSLALVYSLWIAQLRAGQFIAIPGGPVQPPG